MGRKGRLVPVAVTQTPDLDVTLDEVPMALLGAGVPLSLLLDIAVLDLSLSREIAQVERADASWVYAA